MSTGATRPTLEAEIRERMGRVPAIFFAGSSARGAELLWQQAKGAYLDNPIPSRLKEELFTYLSRFCEASYCMVRHAAFLQGAGHPAGDRAAPTRAPEEVLRLLRRPLPHRDAMEEHWKTLDRAGLPLDAWPEDVDSELGQALLACVVYVFLRTGPHVRCLAELRRALGRERLELLLILLGFVRTAHAWTEAHEEIGFERDVDALLDRQPALRVWVDSYRTAVEGEFGIERKARDLAGEYDGQWTTSDERLGGILEDSLNEIYLFDPETLRFEQANRGARENLGYSMDELRSLTPLDLMPEFAVETLDEELTPLRSGEKARIEFSTMFRRKDGSLYPVDVNLQSSSAGPRVYVAIVVDITERLAQKEAIGDLEARAQAILDTAAEAIIAIDESGVIQSVNRATDRLFGYEAEELIGRNVRLLMPARYSEQHDDYIDRYLRTGEARIIGRGRDVEGRRRDGSVFPIRLSVGEALFADGRLFTGIIQDLSEERRAEEALRREHEFSQRLLDTAHAIVLVLDPRGRIVQYNEFMRELCGYDLEEVQGRDWVDTFIPAGERAGVRDVFSRSIEGTRAVGHANQLLLKDGSTRMIQWWDAELRDAGGTLEGLLCIGHDVTDEQRAREDRTDLARILEDSLNEIYVCDAHTLRFKVVNRGARENLGYSLEEMRTLTILDVKPDLSCEQFEALVAPLRAGDRRVEFETVHRRKDGSLYPVEVHVQLGRYEGSESFVAVVLDITERKAAADRDREARRRAQRLEALASMSTLVTGVAHDVGAPMTAILGYAEMMEKSLSEDDKNRRRAHIIMQQVQRVSELIRALLNMARPSEQRIVPLGVGKVLDASLEFYREKLRVHEVIVERSIESVPAVAGDPDRLQQVFLNLIVNAVDAMPNGGTLGVGLASPNPKAVEVRIRDSGIGIDPQDLDRIFDPFFTTKGRGVGTGLGLVVARSIVDEHHGEMTVDSQLGMGTEFVIRLPVAGASSDGPQAVSSA